MQRRPFSSMARLADQRPRTTVRPGGFSTWLAMVALLLQVVVPLGQAVPLPAGTDAPFRTLVVCTGYGLRVLDQSADSRSGASPSAASTLNCPVCSALAFCGVPAPTVAAPLPAGGALGIQTEGLRDLPSDRSPVSLRARGPPPAVV